MLQHYALRLITLDDVLTFLDRLVEKIEEQKLRKLLVGKYSQRFIDEITVIGKLLNGASQTQGEQDQGEESLHPNFDITQLVEIIRELPDDLDLDLLQKLLEHTSKDKDTMERTLEWIEWIIALDASDKMDSVKQISESDFTLSELAEIIKQDPERLRDLIDGNTGEIDGQSTIAELVELLS